MFMINVVLNHAAAKRRENKDTLETRDSALEELNWHKNDVNQNPMIDFTQVLCSQLAGV